VRERDVGVVAIDSSAAQRGPGMTCSVLIKFAAAAAAGAVASRRYSSRGPRRPLLVHAVDRRQVAVSMRASANSAGEGASSSNPTDWRDFRARLVARERQESGSGGGAATAVTSETQAARESEAAGWAHATPLIERGSVILSTPNSRFILDQQYFHKAVILIVKHDEGEVGSGGDVGLILNRPTAYRLKDFELPITETWLEKALRFVGLSTGADSWPIWFGGDCQGLNSPRDEGEPVCIVLHTCERFAFLSQQVISGVFTIGLSQAQTLVTLGQASRDDFLVFVGYCGWGPGQLQREVDRGDAWTVVAADQAALLGDIPTRQRELSEQLLAAFAREAAVARAQAPAKAAAVAAAAEDGAAEARARVGRLWASDIGDGFQEWEVLRAALGPEAAFEAIASRRVADDPEELEHADAVCRYWVERCLVPRSTTSDQASGGLLAERRRRLARLQRLLQERAGGGSGSRGEERRPSAALPRAVPKGAVLRASATHWLLGAPAVRKDRALKPMQHLHKAVALVLEDVRADRPTSLVLLNGPRVGTLSGSFGDCFFGGSRPTESLMLVPGGGIWGQIMLPAGQLENFLASGALEVVEGAQLSDVMGVPAEERWAAMGGKLESLAEAATASLGDKQRRTWYSRFLGVELDSWE